MVRFFLIICLFSGNVFARGVLPPLGKRKYLIDTKVFSVVDIKPEAVNSSLPYLKDPILVERKFSDLNTFRGKKKIIKKNPKYKPAKLSFQSVPVDGSIAKPRIEFNLDSMQVNRVDEVYQLDFIGRIHRSADKAGSTVFESR